MSPADSDVRPVRFLEPARYPLRNPHEIPTPRLLIYRHLIEENLRRMRTHLEAIAPGSGFAHLCPHVKTHKSSWVARLQIEAGITHFKATPHEVEMLLRAGATDIFVAYPLLPHTAARIAQLGLSHSATHLYVQVSRPEHVSILEETALSYGYHWHVLLDVDVGMGRTGSTLEGAIRLYHLIEKSPSLSFAGVHGYDGHNHSPDREVRRRIARESMARLMAVVNRLRDSGAAVNRVVAGGSPTFEPDLRHLLHEVEPPTTVLVSPGTWIYWDSKYDSMMPGHFVFAAVILAQVIDLPDRRLLTLNLGHKRWAVDQGPVEVFSAPGLRVVRVSEEHTVLETDGSRNFQIGDHLLIAPQHACSTVNLWEYATVIDAEGRIEIEACPVDARNR
jgi:D-serine deaminase-like pyridoxal phosphate-dependent protein